MSLIARWNGLVVNPLSYILEKALGLKIKQRNAKFFVLNGSLLFKFIRHDASCSWRYNSSYSCFTLGSRLHISSKLVRIWDWILELNLKYYENENPREVQNYKMTPQHRNVIWVLPRRQDQKFNSTHLLLLTNAIKAK